MHPSRSTATPFVVEADDEVVPVEPHDLETVEQATVSHASRRVVQLANCQSVDRHAVTFRQSLQVVNQLIGHVSQVQGLHVA
jgi:hypothetical protein